jgi:hypothetical protein
MVEYMPTPAPPWRVGATFDHHLNGYGIYGSGCRVAVAGYLGGTETAKTNAAHIVKCVNAYTYLVEALETARAQLVTLGGDHHLNEQYDDKIHAAVLAKIDAALNGAVGTGKQP